MTPVARAIRKPWLYVGLAVVIGVVAIAAVGLHSASRSEERSGGGSLPWDTFGNDPFPYGRQVSFVQGVQAVSYPVFVPNSPMANSGNMSQVYTDDDGDLAFQYSSDITVMMWPSAYTDPVAGLQNVLATTQATAALVQIGDSPGIEIYPNTAANANPAWVEFVRQGVDINLYSSTQSVDTLVAVANSMAQN